jgi:hypothetical protein
VGFTSFLLLIGCENALRAARLWLGRPPGSFCPGVEGRSEAEAITTRETTLWGETEDAEEGQDG